MQYLTKAEIILATEKIVAQFTHDSSEVSEDLFFFQPIDKWSIAQNVQHLIVSTNATLLAFTLPAFIVRLVGGKPNRASKSYEELVDKYTLKLKAGGRASGRFVPKAFDKKYTKKKLEQQWQKATTTFLNALKKNTTETKLDGYLVRHPLLGRITLRELCYFTIYHTAHHLQIIQKIK
jgi:hypothetical protein